MNYLIVIASGDDESGDIRYVGPFQSKADAVTWIVKNEPDAAEVEDYYFEQVDGSGIEKSISVEELQYPEVPKHLSELGDTD